MWQFTAFQTTCEAQWSGRQGHGWHNNSVNHGYLDREGRGGRQGGHRVSSQGGGDSWMVDG